MKHKRKIKMDKVTYLKPSAEQRITLPKMSLKCILKIAILRQENIFIANFIRENKDIWH